MHLSFCAARALPEDRSLQQLFRKQVVHTVRVSNYWQLDKLLQQEPAARDVRAILPEGTMGKLVGILITMLVAEIPIFI